MRRRSGIAVIPGVPRKESGVKIRDSEYKQDSFIFSSLDSQ